MVLHQTILASPSDPTQSIGQAGQPNLSWWSIGQVMFIGELWVRSCSVQSINQSINQETPK